MKPILIEEIIFKLYDMHFDNNSITQTKLDAVVNGVASYEVNKDDIIPIYTIQTKHATIVAKKGKYMQGLTISVKGDVPYEYVNQDFDDMLFALQTYSNQCLKDTDLDLKVLLTIKSALESKNLFENLNVTDKNTKVTITQVNTILQQKVFTEEETRKCEMQYVVEIYDLLFSTTVTIIIKFNNELNQVKVDSFELKLDSGENYKITFMQDDFLLFEHIEGFSEYDMFKHAQETSCAVIKKLYNWTKEE